MFIHMALQATLESMNARVRSALAVASELPSDEADVTKSGGRRGPTEDVLEMLDHALGSSRAEADALRARVSTQSEEVRALRAAVVRVGKATGAHVPDAAVDAAADAITTLEALCRCHVSPTHGCGTCCGDACLGEDTRECCAGSSATRSAEQQRCTRTSGARRCTCTHWLGPALTRGARSLGHAHAYACSCVYACTCAHRHTCLHMCRRAGRHMRMLADACRAVQATLESINARLRSPVATASDEAVATKSGGRRAPTEDVLEMLDHALESSRVEADALRARVSDLDLMLQARDTELSGTRRTQSQMSEDLRRSQVRTCRPMHACTRTHASE